MKSGPHLYKIWNKACYKPPPPPKKKGVMLAGLKAPSSGRKCLFFRPEPTVMRKPHGIEF